MTAAVVRQRLRLADLSPAVVAAYREGTLTLDDVMAFTVTDDHAAQERVHRNLLPWQRSPATIRRLLTHSLLPVTDKRVRLVGLDAYGAAGGAVQRDLFTEDGGGWIADAALLERLVGERMEAEAETLRAEGWRWVAVGDAASDEVWRCRRVWPTRASLTEAEEARRDELATRSDEIANDYGGADDLPEQIAAEFDGIEAELAALEHREEAWRPEDVALAGCVLTLAGDGRLSVTRGLVRPEDEPKPVAVTGEGEAEDAGGEGEANPVTASGDAGTDGDHRAEDEERDDHLPPLTAALSAELDFHRTLGLRAELADQPDLALRVLVHSLAGDAFYGRGFGETVASFPAYALTFGGAPGLTDSPTKRVLDEARGARARDAPGRAARPMGLDRGAGHPVAAAHPGRVRRAGCRRRARRLVARGRRALCRGRAQGRPRHAAVVEGDARDLPRPHAESRDPRRRPRGRRRGGRVPSRRDEEGADGRGGRVAPRLHRMAAAAPPRAG
ncbi:hypothetical protein ACE7GA_26710 (plasmid) [Roseomonas sp. CCTCC AB2023176]|uniref:hypothetical protein n=1 Tax=Roseomonas sp. CCTCC AB2023176 TaxID=3342640 RepID=UPI0035D82AEB